jgi:hypothetical protein
MFLGKFWGLSAWMLERIMVRFVAVLEQHGIVEVMPAEEAGHCLADQRAQHRTWHNRKRVRHLEDDREGGQRSPDNGSEARAHSDGG